MSISSRDVKGLIPLTLLVILLIGVPMSVLVHFVLAAPAAVLTPEWSTSNLGSNWEGGLVIGDIDNDGYEEIVYAGYSFSNASKRRISVLNRFGTILYTWYNSRIGGYTQPQLADVDGDGVLDILVPLYYRAGIAVLKYYSDSPNLRPMELSGNDTFIRYVQGPTGSGSIMSKPVAGDIDGDGDLEIFVASQDVGYVNSGGFPDGYDGTITLFDHLGNQLAQTFSWRSCSGGLSLGDTDNDGVFELYMGDRHMYQRDGGYGKGCRSLWADNLTQRWNRLDFLCSSQAPVLADVFPGDGVQEVVVSDQRGGLYVLNSTNGAIIRNYSGKGLPVHYALTVYDIDSDGNMEVLCNDGDHDNYPWDTYVFDLVTGEVDAILSLAGGDSKWSPLVADISPAHPGMEIIVGPNGTDFVGNWWNGALMIFDSEYNSVQNITGLGSQVGYPLVQNLDDDSNLELVTHSSGGTIYVYEATATAPADRIRSEVTFFGECRTGAAVYEPEPWAPDYWTAPLVAPVALGDNSLAVARGSNQLSFRTRDHQSDTLTWNVTASPDIISGLDSGAIPMGTYAWNTRSVSISAPLAYDTSYTWTVSVSDGTYTTTRSYIFRTELEDRANTAPTQGTPVLIGLDGNTTANFECTNQSTADADNDDVTNIYRWLIEDEPVQSLLLPFDTRNETMTKDYSGNNNNAQVIGAAWVEDGLVGGAYSFDGQNDAIIVSDGGMGYFDDTDYGDSNPELGGDGTWDEITVEAWVYLTEDNVGSRIVGKIPSYELGFRSGGTNRLLASMWPGLNEMSDTIPDNANTRDRAQSITANVGIELSTWYHIAMTYKNGTGLFLYFNGEQVASRTGIQGPVKNSTGEPVYIGALVEPFKGLIDEVRVSPHYFYPEQVMNRYNESKDGYSNSSIFNPTGMGGVMGDMLTCDVIPTDSFEEGSVESASVILENSQHACMLVVRGIDDGVWYRPSDGVSFDNWTGLGGLTLDTPAATVFNDQLHIIVNGSDGGLWWSNINLTDDSFSGWQGISGHGTPSLTTNGTHLYLVVRGTDNGVWYRSFDGVSWSDWGALGGLTANTPAAAVFNGQLHIVVNGTDGTLWWCSESQPWQGISGAGIPTFATDG